MKTSRVRTALTSLLAATGLILGTAATGTAATGAGSRPTVIFGPGEPSAASAEVCADDTCASTDRDLTLVWSSAAGTAGCRFRLVIDWGDGSAAQTVDLTGTTKATSWPVAHTYPGRVAARRPYPVDARATVTRDARSRGCTIESAALTFTLLCTDRQLSGPDWDGRWPGGNRDVAALNDTFRPRVEKFVAALDAAGATVTPQSTLRSPQRSYLMHFAYLVARQQLDPQDVPAYAPLPGEKSPKICWTHRDTTGAVDGAESVAAARDLLTALGVDRSLRTAPALRSRHNAGDAIDMKISWTTKRLRVQDAGGHIVTIASGPRDGTNARLIDVGAGYGVNHFSPVAVDRNHWSSDGR
ncbi:hypothetical protein KIH74_30645 [Kineosporia sp. J2-2]|uniref:Uncharacterized protein n=1 Tax=Kineosporia corallincola TaxID=2835133 RepID=A0ABS5TRC5_9ACTN|nr:hypothetical protein [Kineosporia corallincola]MBT0773344.1 hypothetical protein [Kineosporia corallincola]